MSNSTSSNLKQETAEKENLNLSENSVNNMSNDDLKEEKSVKQTEVEESDKAKLSEFKVDTRVIFHRLNWSNIVAICALIFLPIFNYPFTSKYGAPYEYRFFLDPELLSNLDMDRNLMELALPIPIYIFLGILPGLLGLLLIAYTLLSSTPHVTYLNSENFRLYEMKVVVPIKNDFSNDSLQYVNVGSKRMGGKSWLGFFGLAFLASMVWYYGFDSVLSSGNWYYFSITQPIWDGEVAIGELNLGFHLFITVLLLLGSGLILVLFPRKNLIMETKDAKIQFAYSRITVKNLNSDTKGSSLIYIFNKLRSKKLLKRNAEEISSSNENTGSEEETSITSVLKKTKNNKYTPRFKLLLLLLSVIFIIAIQLIPGFFFGDFLIPFGVVGLMVFLNLLLKTIFYDWYSSQEILDYDNDFGTLRRNPVSGSRIKYIQNPIKSKPIRELPKSSTFIKFMSGFLLWEICVVIFNMIEFWDYFVTDPWTVFQLLLCILFVFTLVYYYFNNETKTALIPKAQRNNIDEKPESAELFAISWEEQQRTMIDEYQDWRKRLQIGLSKKGWKKRYLSSIMLFGLPLILFIGWMILYLTMAIKFLVYIFI
ncbi:MAG: hypothetical protein GF364_17560 [Candidatus Lokiarchaeota archaeon]|nr:hypothetical protein [Candidatus Lokiarchaeota archaeon]